jgi:hypothetical protein
MRGAVILFVVAFHSVMAYLGFLGSSAFSFDEPPYSWRAFPMIDSHRWFGLDIFCAWQDVYLMSLFFFLSALVTWPSLARKGIRQFLSDRLLRLGAPFVFGLVVVMPLALYPVYRLTAADPGLIAYARRYLALPFWPDGPMWFLWQLFALTLVAAGLRRFAPRVVAFLAGLSSRAIADPGRYLIGLAAVCALAYVPLALAFTPFQWADYGPFSMQLSRPLLYAVYYFAGLGIGASGLERGLLASEGRLARRWSVWFACALGSFLAWMGFSALAMSYATQWLLQLGADVSFAVAGASGCLFMTAVFLRFAAKRSQAFGYLSRNAFGLYIFHYIFVVWLQYSLLGLALFAVVKATIVFAGSVILALAATAVLRLSGFGSLLIGERPRGFWPLKGKSGLEASQPALGRANWPH